MRTHSFFVTLLLLAALMMSSCAKIEQDKSMAQKATATLHAQFNEQKFKEIYDAANPAFKASETEEAFVILLQAMHRKLGRHVKTSESNWRFNSTNGESTLVITEQNEYEHGRAFETYTYATDGESAVLQDYHLESRDMMIK